MKRGKTMKIYECFQNKPVELLDKDGNVFEHIFEHQNFCIGKKFTLLNSTVPGNANFYKLINSEKSFLEEIDENTTKEDRNDLRVLQELNDSTGIPIYEYNMKIVGNYGENNEI